MRLSLDGSLLRGASPASVAERVRLVLETRPGRIPWHPEFGCDLDPILGRALTIELVSEVQMRIKSALSRFLPDLSITRLEVRIQTDLGADMRSRRLPIAEASLVPFGANAMLDIEIELQTPAGPVRLQLEVPS